MGKFAAFKLPLKGMPNGTQTFEYDLGKDFFSNMESPDIHKGNVKVTLTVKNTGGIYDLNFELKGIVYLLCDRCLDEMEHEVNTNYHLTVKYGEEYCDENDDVLVIPESDMYLNVAYMIYDSVALTVPIKHVHPMGKCNKAMTATLKKHTAKNLNEDDEDIEEMDDDVEVLDFDGADDSFDSSDIEDSQATDPRWDALKKLKDNN